jgi:hypothetical protein
MYAYWQLVNAVYQTKKPLFLTFSLITMTCAQATQPSSCTNIILRWGHAKHVEKESSSRADIATFVLDGCFAGPLIYFTAL